MGKASEGIFGPVSGKVGNLVWYTVKGETYVRTAPSKRRGRKTKKEKANTSGFAKVQAFMKPISMLLRDGFKDYGSKTGGYKAAVSYALLNAVEGTYPDQFVNPALVRISGGDLHMASSVQAVLEPDHSLRFTWSTEEGENGSAYDQAFLLAYAPHENKMVRGNLAWQSTGAFRMTGEDSLQLVPDQEDQTYHVYLGFVSSDRTIQAHSVYLGSVLVEAKAKVERKKNANS